MKYLMGIIALSIAACANPNKAKEINPTMEEKGQYQGAKVGLNEDKEVIVQSEKAADQELREVSWKAYDVEQKLNKDHEMLTRCREEVADARLGGTGEVTDIPEIDNMKPTTEVREEFGITPSGELKFVRREFFREKLDAAKKYLERLESMTKLVAKSRRTCEREMSAARVKHGLPAKRYEGKGRYENGSYVQTRAAENNLDDAFRISSEEAAKAAGKSGGN